MGLEVSRLARNNADWHRLLEICALADTLILDEDGVYEFFFCGPPLIITGGTRSPINPQAIK